MKKNQILMLIIFTILLSGCLGTNENDLNEDISLENIPITSGEATLGQDNKSITFLFETENIQRKWILTQTGTPFLANSNVEEILNQESESINYRWDFESRNKGTTNIVFNNKEEENKPYEETKYGIIINEDGKIYLNSFLFYSTGKEGQTHLEQMNLNDNVLELQCMEVSSKYEWTMKQTNGSMLNLVSHRQYSNSSNDIITIGHQEWTLEPIEDGKTELILEYKTKKENAIIKTIIYDICVVDGQIILLNIAYK